jgi:hypothetical protein
MVHVSSQTTLEWLENHFMPILQQLEEDYDDYFDIDTRVKARDLGPIESPQTTPTPSTRASSNRAIIKAIKESNNSLKESFKDLKEAILETRQPSPQVPLTQPPPRLYHFC